MKTIVLQRMELRNFKGVANANYEFGNDTKIVGGNATGKSTIFDAYLWCLFDKNQAGNSAEVQPLDSNNEVLHKLTTSVKLYLTIDDDPFIVERTLAEDWVKARGTAELVLKGTKSEYAINEVPMSKSQFNDKLGEILPLDRWFQISSIGVIPNMEQKACRAALQSIAPAIDEAKLAAPFPAVVDAMSKGLNMDELAAMTKQNKQKAKTELESIPAAMDAQDRLRVNEDFEALEKELKVTEEDIKNNERELESLQKGTNEAEIEHANMMRAELLNVNKQIAELELKIHSESQKKYNEITSSMNKANSEAGVISNRIELNKNSADAMLQEVAAYRNKVEDCKKRWLAKNEEAYKEPEINGICPACGQPLPESRIWEAQKKAREEWNTAKGAALLAIQTEAEGYKARINDILKENEAKKAQLEEDTKRLAELQEDINHLESQRNQLPTEMETLESDDEYIQASKTKLILENKINATISIQESDNNVRIQAIKTALPDMKSVRDDLLRRLAGRDTNAKIEAERKRLEEDERNLANAIAKYEGIEAQITGYRKAKITAVENGVSSLFTMVRWKMYEPNVTNDGEKEICQAIIDGKPYKQQNHATQVNAGIDICNGFAKAYDICVPLFIDNVESVEHPLQARGQRITLAVVPNSELKVNKVTE